MDSLDITILGIDIELLLDTLQRLKPESRMTEIVLQTISEQLPIIVKVHAFVARR